ASDAIVYLSHTSCLGCDTSDAGVLEVNAHAADIATRFNAGLDVWANAGADNLTYYNFLPSGSVASGLPISGAAGFTATPAGVAIGITPDMINGFPTHNRFTSFSPAFTVTETRPAV